MKESIALKKQQLERNIQEAEKTWNRLEKFFNIFIRGLWLISALLLIFGYSSPTFILTVLFCFMLIGLSLVLIFFKKLIVIKPRESGRIEFDIMRAELNEEAQMNK
ncbi:MAG: hypothetical protein RSE18_14030 [Acinetobacter sp.]|jgi:hypothetical protein